MKWLKVIALVWMVRSFWTQQGAADFLNSLPLARSLEAKVSVARMTEPIYVFYRGEQS